MSRGGTPAVEVLAGGMQLAQGLPAATAALAAARTGARRLALVPTMGALHDGHLSLVRRAQELADFVAVSIFVNPLQFAPTEDLSRYPRDLAGDAAKLDGIGTNLCFTFAPEELYPPGFCTYVTVDGPPAEGLCAASRPGHFRGVTTVVAKLFGLVRPQVAVFGQKDLQQALVLRRMSADLNLGIELVIAPTVREPSGLAMSSRNMYLRADQRVAALSVSRGLDRAAAAAGSGERDPRALEALVKAAPPAGTELRWDYVEVRGLPDLLRVTAPLRMPVAILCAAWVGSTRLIDNRVLPADALWTVADVEGR